MGVRGFGYICTVCIWSGFGCIGVYSLQALEWKSGGGIWVCVDYEGVYVECGV